ncbi:hypothetical protein JHD46_02170 [Sulfurimonas sp. SAG-AH-194-C20]|nr:hypothetical protein [Sulfurimonas sp. SAG-AH-194-C20]MDF1878441.1 hypothetical protein [Sulfurimonas sp. SAG-AH-194-C20]
MKRIVIYLWILVSIVYADSIDLEDYNNWVDDETVSKKIYNFNGNMFVLKKHEFGGFEICYTLGIFKKGDKKPTYGIKYDDIELMDTPYKFPYVVFHFTGLGASGVYHSIRMYNISHGLKEVQWIGYTNFDTTLNGLRRTHSNENYDYRTNPIIIGGDGAYYIEKYVAQGNAECNACQKYKRVFYRFNGGKFVEYKEILWEDTNTTARDILFPRKTK